MLVHGSGFPVDDLGVMLVHMDSGQPLAVVLLARNEDSDERAFSGSLTAEHGDLDALLHILQNIPIDGNLRHKGPILYSLSYFLHFYLSILIPRHVKQYGQCLLHLHFIYSHADSIVFYSDSVHCPSKTLIQSKNHLGC